MRTFKKYFWPLFIFVAVIALLVFLFDDAVAQPKPDLIIVGDSTFRPWLNEPFGVRETIFSYRVWVDSGGLTWSYHFTPGNRLALAWSCPIANIANVPDGADSLLYNFVIDRRTGVPDEQGTLNFPDLLSIEVWSQGLCQKVTDGFKQSFWIQNTHALAPGVVNSGFCAWPLMCISPGWCDKYLNRTDITDLPDGLYVLKITVNPNSYYAEQNLSNNSAYAPFRKIGDAVVLDWLAMESPPVVITHATSKRKGNMVGISWDGNGEVYEVSKNGVSVGMTVAPLWHDDYKTKSTVNRYAVRGQRCATVGEWVRVP